MLKPRNYHVVRISQLVNLALRQKIENNSAYQEMDYAGLYSEIMAHHYTYADSFSYEMQKLGNRSEEILYDVECLQKKWATEKGIKIDPNERWQFKIVAEQLKSLNPDVVYLQGFTRITPIDIESIKDTLPNLKLIVVHSGFAGGIDLITKNTLVYCGLPSIRDYFCSAGADGRLLYHCFDTRVDDLIEINKVCHEFSFAGSSGYGYGAIHKVRYWELLKLAHNTPLTLALDDRIEKQCEDSNPFIAKPLKPKYYSLNDRDCESYPEAIAPLQFLIEKCKQHEPVYGLPYYQFLSDSQMTLQRHSHRTSKGEVGAMRMFQATGVGTCLITDRGSNLHHLYEEDSEVVTYDNVQECAEKVRYLLKFPKVAQAIADKGQQRTLKEHTAEIRYRMVDEDIKRILFK